MLSRRRWNHLQISGITHVQVSAYSLTYSLTHSTCLISYPWNAGEVGCTAELKCIKELNDQMIARTQQLLSSSGKNQVGSCQYNLTLINKCFKEGDIELKLEPTFNSEQMAVSWHADSSLEHFSSIGIYHFLMDEQARQKVKEKPWRIALRVMNNAEGPTSQKLKTSSSTEVQVTAPPIAVELPDKYSLTHLLTYLLTNSLTLGIHTICWMTSIITIITQC